MVSSSSAFAQEGGNEPLADQNLPASGYSEAQIENFASQIVGCAVNAEGAEVVTLQNGDKITNSAWHNDSFSIAVEDSNGDAAIYDPNTDRTIRVTDLCVRDDIDNNEDLEINTDLRAFDRLCVESGLFVEMFDRKTGEISLNKTPIKSVFGNVAENDDIVGICSFEIDGESVEAPIISMKAYDLLP